MRDIRVWAPSAQSVEVEGADAPRPLAQLAPDGDHPAGGWWRLEDDLPAGTDYAFSLDGSDALPDPRSPHQPRGVHAPSRTVDHGAFAWSDQGWRGHPLSDAIIYELHVGTFSQAGTFDGAIEHLEHLTALGVTAVELMPVAEFDGDRGWGYDGVDLFAPHHAYGGPEGLKRLVDACHRRGLAVIIDVVYNHLGPSGNYLGRFGPYFIERYRTPWGPAPNLDGAGSDEVRAFFVENALHWLRDYHCDGLRIDAVQALLDLSSINILEEIATRVDALQEQLQRTLWVIAESDLNDPRLVRSRQQGGYGLDAAWSDDFHHALHALLTGERHGYYGDFGTIADVAKALRDVYVYDGRYSAYRRRRYGRPVGDINGARFLGYLQNHDHVGNRPLGQRSSALMSPGRLKTGAALVLLSPFVPLLFQGEEWGAATPFYYFTDHRDAEVARAVREGRRHDLAAFGWPEHGPDPQAEETFTRSRLDWTELAREPHADILRWYRQLVELRRSTAELRDGRRDRTVVAFSEEERWLTVRRGDIELACNIGDSPVEVPINGVPDRLLMASEPGTRPADGAATRSLTTSAVELPGDAVAIFRLRLA